MSGTDGEIYAKAVETLRRGGTILYPTDTVWGIGCDASDPEAVAKVFAMKKRPDSKSLVLLASDMDMICRYIREIPEIAVQLAEISDTPLTIIYPGAISSDTKDTHTLASSAVAEDGSVGIRIPVTEFCRNLVRRFGRPIVSTSANVSGEPAPKKYSEIKEEIAGAVDYVFEPSFEKYSTGKPSSIIKIGTDSSVEIIRK